MVNGLTYNIYVALTSGHFHSLVDGNSRKLPTAFCWKANETYIGGMKDVSKCEHQYLTFCMLGNFSRFFFWSSADYFSKSFFF